MNEDSVFTERERVEDRVIVVRAAPYVMLKVLAKQLHVTERQLLEILIAQKFAQS